MGNMVFLRVAVAVLLLWAGSAGADDHVVRTLVDQGHDQRFLIEENGELQLSELAGIILSRGSLVASTKKPLNDELLKDISALVISGPFKALRPEEVEAVARFVDRGGASGSHAAYRIATDRTVVPAGSGPLQCDSV